MINLFDCHMFPTISDMEPLPGLKDGSMRRGTLSAYTLEPVPALLRNKFQIAGRNGFHFFPFAHR